MGLNSKLASAQAEKVRINNLNNGKVFIIYTSIFHDFPWNPRHTFNSLIIPWISWIPFRRAPWMEVPLLLNPILGFRTCITPWPCIGTAANSWFICRLLKRNKMCVNYVVTSNINFSITNKYQYGSLEKFNPVGEYHRGRSFHKLINRETARKQMTFLFERDEKSDSFDNIFVFSMSC